MNWSEWIKIIEKCKTHRLPGAEAQYRMAPVHRRGSIEFIENFRKSAVMIAVCRNEQDQAYLPLIVRHAYHGVHSGQVSLPGGKHEPNDLTLADTACRECEEEIGITNLEMIRELTPLQIPVSQFLVHPFIGVHHPINPSFELNAREVSQIIKLNLDDLLKMNEKNEEWVKAGPSNMKVPVFNIENQQVWGATAMMLNEFKVLINEVYETL